MMPFRGDEPVCDLCFGVALPGLGPIGFAKLIAIAAIDC